MSNEPRRPVTDKLDSALPLDDPELRAIVVAWADSLVEKVAAMRAAADGSDLPSLASLAHWLKGSGGTAGYDAFTDPARRLEQAAQAGERETIATTLREIEQLCAAVRAGLSAS